MLATCSQLDQQNATRQHHPHVRSLLFGNHLLSKGYSCWHLWVQWSQHTYIKGLQSLPLLWWLNFGCYYSGCNMGTVWLLVQNVADLHHSCCVCDVIPGICFLIWNNEQIYIKPHIHTCTHMPQLVWHHVTLFHCLHNVQWKICNSVTPLPVNFPVTGIHFFLHMNNFVFTQAFCEYKYTYSA